MPATEPATEPASLPLEACTLPTAEQPLRVDELRALFAQALEDVDVRGPHHVVFRLRPDAAGSARDLAARESACCTFFTFDVRERPGGVDVDVRVPAAYREVLAGMVALARQGLG